MTKLYNNYLKYYEKEVIDPTECDEYSYDNLNNTEVISQEQFNVNQFFLYYGHSIFIDLKKEHKKVKINDKVLYEIISLVLTNKVYGIDNTVKDLYTNHSASDISYFLVDLYSKIYKIIIDIKMENIIKSKYKFQIYYFIAIQFLTQYTVFVK